MEVSSERDARGREKEGRRERCGGRERGRERDAGVGIHLPNTYVCFSSSLASPSRRRSTLPTPSALYSIIPLTLARAARAWRFTLNAGPLPPVPQRRARVLPRGDRRRRRKLWEKGEGWRERERGDVCASLSRSLPRVLTRPTEEKIVRKYADTKRNGGPIRANVSRDKKEISSIPAFRSRTPRFRARFRSQLSRLFAEFSNFPPCSLSLSLSHLFREFSCRSCGMNGNGRHARVYGHVLFSIYLCGLTWSKERPRANWFLSVLSGRGRTRHGNLVTRGGDEIKNRESNFLAPRNYIFFPA